MYTGLFCRPKGLFYVHPCFSFLFSHFLAQTSMGIVFNLGPREDPLIFAQAAAPEAAPDENFSNISSLLNSRCEITINLTFENFHAAVPKAATDNNS